MSSFDDEEMNISLSAQRGGSRNVAEYSHFSKAISFPRYEERSFVVLGLTNDFYSPLVNNVQLVSEFPLPADRHSVFNPALRHDPGYGV